MSENEAFEGGMAGEHEGGASDIIIRTVVRRWWQVLLIGVVVSGIGVAVSFNLPPSYIAQAKVLIEATSLGLPEADAILNPAKGGGKDFYNTRVALIRSGRVMGRAVESLREKWRLSVDELSDVDAFVTQYSVEAISDRYVNIATIQAKGPKADVAADVANAVLDAFKVVDKETRKGSVQEAKAEISSQLEAVKRKLEAQDSALKLFRDRNKIVNPEDLNEPQTQLALLKSKASDAKFEYDFTLAKKNALDKLVEKEKQEAEQEPEPPAPKPEEPPALEEDAAAAEETIAANMLAGDLNYLQAEIRKTRDNIKEMKERYKEHELKDRPSYQTALDRLASLQKELNETTSKLKDQQAKSEDKRRKASDAARLRSEKQADEAQKRQKAEQRRQQRHDALQDALQTVMEQLERADQAHKRYQVDLDTQQKMVGEMQKAVDDCRKLLDERNRFRELDASLKNRFQQVELADNVIGGTVEEIDRARPPLEPNWPRKSKSLAVSILLGLFVGFAFAFWREHGDTSLKTADQARMRLRLPILGNLPDMKGPGAAGVGRMLLVGDSAETAEAEHFRHLRGRLLHAYCNGNGSDVKTIAVTSAAAGEGKTTIALNLAVSLSQLGKRVLLIDADLHRPKLHELLDVPNENGLAEVLTGEVALENAMRPTSTERVDVLPAGVPPAKHGELLQVGAFERVLKQAAEQYDLVLVDCCPVIGPSDALQVARVADGVLFVVQAGKVRLKLLTRACSDLSEMGANMLGTVFNREKLSKDQRYYYHEYYRGKERKY